MTLKIGPEMRHADPALGLAVEARGHFLTTPSGDTREGVLDWQSVTTPGSAATGLELSLATGYSTRGGDMFGLLERTVTDEARFPSAGSAPEPRPAH